MRLSLLVASALMLCLPSAGALAQQCDNLQQPSPTSNAKTSISFQNTTASQINLLWADFDGVLTHYATLQPKQTANFESYVGHIWYLEAFTPEGAVCLGPVVPTQTKACRMTIGLDQGGFLYEQQNCKVE